MTNRCPGNNFIITVSYNFDTAFGSHPSAYIVSPALDNSVWNVSNHGLQFALNEHVYCKIVSSMVVLDKFVNSAYLLKCKLDDKKEKCLDTFNFGGFKDIANPDNRFYFGVTTDQDISLTNPG